MKDDEIPESSITGVLGTSGGGYRSAPFSFIFGGRSGSGNVFITSLFAQVNNLEGFLPELEALMKKYRIDKIDVHWKGNHDER